MAREEMTDMERMIWAAAFVRHLDEFIGSETAAADEAFRYVRRFRTIKIHDLSSDGAAMVKSLQHKQ